MSPKTGRPPKEVTKSVNIGIRITQETANKLEKCAKQLHVSRTQVIEQGIDLVARSLEK